MLLLSLELSVPAEGVMGQKIIKVTESLQVIFYGQLSPWTPSPSVHGQAVKTLDSGSGNCWFESLFD